MQAYVAKEGCPVGPFTEEQLHQKIKSGEFAETDLAWRDGIANWTPLFLVLGIQKNAPALPANMPPIAQMPPPPTRPASIPPPPDHLPTGPTDIREEAKGSHWGLALLSCLLPIAGWISGMLIFSTRVAGLVGAAGAGLIPGIIFSATGKRKKASTCFVSALIGVFGILAILVWLIVNGL